MENIQVHHVVKYRFGKRLYWTHARIHTWIMISDLLCIVDCTNKCWEATGIMERTLETEVWYLISICILPVTTCMSMAKELNSPGAPFPYV